MFTIKSVSRISSVLFVVVSILALTFSALNITPVRAATIRYAVPGATGTGDCASWVTACTLQTALANAGSGDEIWVVAGTHKPTTGTDRAATFQLKSVSIYGGFAGTETARDQRDFTANVTILSGEIGAAGNSDNSYHVVTGATGAILDGFTITAGNGGEGGGMFNGAGSPTLTNVTFNDNSATYRGGGMFNGGSPTLTNVTFSGNSATNGGGMSNSGNPTLTNVTFSNNSAVSSINMGFGGGMYNGAGSPTLTNVTFSDNSARYGGGGMYNGAGSPTLTNVTFSGNSASEGGGMYTGPMFDLSTFSGNSATTSGGGMNNTIGGLTLTNVTFNGNSASEGCGMYNFVSNSTTIRNTIFWGNAGAQISNSCATSVISDSVIQGGCPAGSTCTNIITTSPMLGPLGNYGGFTQTIPLLAGSSAIDAGDDTVCPATDQRGVPRPQGAHCDIGAYEVDNTAPTVVSSMRANPSPTSAVSVSFIVTFSEPVTCVDTGDFSLTTSGVTGASIGSVSGSGATYKVNVKTGSGNGAIRLDIPASATITDLAGNSLASLPYTGGQVYTVNKIATLTSIATQDGWILELSENSNVGGAMKNTTTTLRLGDNVARGQ
ncbi:MAG: choice-of-anchor Q domain-containing protein, partial [Anaerolineales bacterium]